VVAARAVPTAQRAAATAAPAFPLPSGHYFAQGAAPRCHDGRVEADRAHIRTFQKRMIQRGWNLGSEGADGRFGPDTEKAVTAFQKEKALKVDGIVGPDTWRAAWEARVT
jgi:peptidoglycan hydrolase-like protein with peptidoglycan-binding domain